MLSLLLRILRVFWRGRRAPRLEMSDVSVLRLRVAPDDLDFNLHMNNGRYLTLMDLGRLDFAIRSTLWREAVARKWRAVLGSATIRYRRSLAPFQRFELETRLLGFQERWFVFEQRFVVNGQLHALAIARGVFLAPGGARVAPADVLAAAGVTTPLPPTPSYVDAWAAADDAAWAAASPPH